jgi:hypothetical protein
MNIIVDMQIYFGVSIPVGKHIQAKQQHLQYGKISTNVFKRCRRFEEISQDLGGCTVYYI